ncbi:MAG: hypothetical protein QXL77_08305 [Candidatus Bathyarchaeia archaeon]
MKTIKVSDETHKKLTEILGKLTAETGKIHTYEDVIKVLIQNSTWAYQQIDAKKV